MPRATACSSSTMRMVAATRGCYTGDGESPASVARTRRGTLADATRAPRHIRPRRRAAARTTDTDILRFQRHGHRPSDACRRTSRPDRQEGRPPSPRRPAARRRLRPRHRLVQRVHRRARLRAAPPTFRSELPGRPVDRRQEGPAGPRIVRPGPPGQPPDPPCRPVPGPHDRGTDRGRAARRRSASRRRSPTSTAPCSIRASPCASGRCPITCRSRSSTRSRR